MSIRSVLLSASLGAMGLCLGSCQHVGNTEPAWQVTSHAESAQGWTSSHKATLYVMGDNQERELFGEATWYSGATAQDFSKVAIRSVQQDLYSKFLTQTVVDTIGRAHAGGTPPPVILHLGDLLDYGCRSEFDKIAALEWLRNPNLYVAPGNHDVIFGGNASYGGPLGQFFLKLKGIDDPSLDSHHNAVCRRGVGRVDPDVEPVFKSTREWIEQKRSDSRYLGAKRRKIESYRELPNKLRCSYLRLKAQGSSLPSQKAQWFCDDTLFYSVFSAEHPEPLAPTEFALGATPDALRVSMRGGERFNDWQPGHLAQRILVPLESTNSSEAPGFIAVILLDTVDWDTPPSWGFFLQSDAAQGAVGKAQKEAVVEWIEKLSQRPEVKGVIFGGHYPLKDLNRQTGAWLRSLDKMQKVVPLYLSAHTHTGYVDMPGTDRSRDSWSEINVGSLVDKPVHYRSVEMAFSKEPAKLRVRTVMHDLTQVCESSDGLREARKRGTDEASAFKKRILPGHDKYGQWCERLAHASRELSPYAPEIPVVDWAQCKNSNRALDSVLLAETRMLTQLSSPAATEKRQEVACTVIGGAEQFSLGEGANPPRERTLYFNLSAKNQPAK